MEIIPQVRIVFDFMLTCIGALHSGIEWFKGNWWWLIPTIIIFVIIVISVLGSIAKKVGFDDSDSFWGIVFLILGLPILCWCLLFKCCVQCIKKSRKAAKKTADFAKKTADGITSPDSGTSIELPIIKKRKFFFSVN